MFKSNSNPILAAYRADPERHAYWTVTEYAEMLDSYRFRPEVRLDEDSCSNFRIYRTVSRCRATTEQAERAALILERLERVL